MQHRCQYVSECDMCGFRLRRCGERATKTRTIDPQQRWALNTSCADNTTATGRTHAYSIRLAGTLEQRYPSGVNQMPLVNRHDCRWPVHPYGPPFGPPCHTNPDEVSYSYNERPSSLRAFAFNTLFFVFSEIWYARRDSNAGPFAPEAFSFKLQPAC